MDASKPDLEQLAQRLTTVAQQLAEVCHRLDDVETELHDEPGLHKSTVSMGNGEKRPASNTEDKMFNPEAGP